MASSSNDEFTLYYEETPSVIDVSVSQIQSKSIYPSFSQAAETWYGLVPHTKVKYSWSEPHCAKSKRNRRGGDLFFARVSVFQSLESWQEGGFGEFVRESNRRMNQVFRCMTIVGSSAGRMVKLPLLERAGISALAGGIAGGFTNATLHPIDTVKTKLQTRGASKLYSGPLDVVSKVIAKQGIAGLYSGVQAAFVGSIISSSIYFGTYELGKGVFTSIGNCPKTLVPPLAAALGNITSSAILVPKEVVKQRLQAGMVGSELDVFLQTIRTEGIGGLYAGYSAALLRNLPSNIISFSTFEYLKLAWLKDSEKTTLEPWQSVISGAAAGALSASLTTPLDVAKTRLMTQARKSVTSAGLSGVRAEAAARAQAIAAYTYTGVASTLHQIWVEEGALGLTQGMGPRLFYSACFSALGFFAFETTRVIILKKYLEDRAATENVDVRILRS
ncbi:protein MITOFERRINLIKE 1, chloroplastic [Physcomitrium patens]|uniref:Mitochondrial carrier protein n=1 Tax=Physcomitrium patens TaxID=3218 RepID=A0A2K1ILS5_PHYPA|nr:protein MITOFERRINLIKE 1, chloroplastic-like [Physcomitrium patens]PNR30223.1 hypothetical protein PHYPA_026539 [Physcomitrium patens]|eukprot:XP_024361501.1 protein MITOFERRINLIKE 1, chloroplastic-like [Physcomitrella patens]